MLAKKKKKLMTDETLLHIALMYNIKLRIAKSDCVQPTALHRWYI